MPAGGSAVGFAYFAIAKFLGYTAFCRWVIEPRLLGLVRGSPSNSAHLETADFDSPEIPSAFEAGAARTVLGVAAGSLAGLLFFYGIFGHISDSIGVTVLFFALLVPIRIFEWRFLLWWMYREFPLDSGTRGRLITFGILASFALDAAGILAAFVLPGGIWIC